MSKADLVRALREAGWESVHQTTVTRLEEGQRPPRLGEALLIAQVVGESTSRLIREPRSAHVEDWLESDIESVLYDYNRVVDGVEGLLVFQRQLARHVDEAESGLLGEFDSRLASEVPMTPRLRELINEARSLAAVSVEDAVSAGRAYEQVVQSGDWPEGADHTEADPFHLRRRTDG